MKRNLKTSLIIVIFLSLFNYCNGETPVMNKSKQQEKVFKTEISLKYLLYLPNDYNSTGSSFPLIIFLHGVGERGDNLAQLKVHGIPKILENKKDFPFVVVSPQCPKDGWWTDYTDTLKTLIDYVKAEYNIDASRVYMTGLSMGGFGTWTMAERYPDLFAAVAPVCGGGEKQLAKYIKSPVWAFHGAKDDVVSMQRSQEMVDAVKAIGGNVEFTIYPELGHNCWDVTYDNEELYKWFLSHKNDKK